jgi:xylulokinase
MPALSLGLDLSTQSLSAVLLDLETGSVVWAHSLDYLADERLRQFGLREDYLLWPRVPGEADQPPQLFFRALDALFADLRESPHRPTDVRVVNHSAQQHGHVYLNAQADQAFARLHKRGVGRQADLASLLSEALAYGAAPIWRTSNTTAQVDFIRKAAGGPRRMIALSGSDAPLRFTGAVIRRVAQQFPEVYRATTRIHLLSSLLAAILSGRADVPVDTGNACGMSLMNYGQQRWSRTLLRATADGLPGGERGLRARLPRLALPTEVLGRPARYFVEKYSLSPQARVVAGSGDNPQTKVLVPGDLLSLGTSFVSMVATEGRRMDFQGFANAMYDGLGRPFMFGCRTNGAMVWDRVRAAYGLAKKEYGPTEKALARVAPGRVLFFWQPEAESFPISGPVQPTRIGFRPGLAADFAGIVDASLAAVYIHSRAFSRRTRKPLFVTGGPAASPEVLRRVAALWQRPVTPVEVGGAALGAAVAGTYALARAEGRNFDPAAVTARLFHAGRLVEPQAADVQAYHGPEGFLARFEAAEARIRAQS